MVQQKVLDPLNMLIEQMQRVGKGDFEISQMSHYTNEIGQINSHFLQMVNEIREMLKRVERISNEKAEIEFQVLQQQINPHFLYNTLDFINWMAIRAHADDISKAVVRLSEFFRLSLSNGVSLLTIDEELQRIAAYMDIQNLIFKGAHSIFGGGSAGSKETAYYPADPSAVYRKFHSPRIS